QPPVRALDLVLVEGAAGGGRPPHPHAAAVDPLEGVDAAVPAVPLRHHRDPPGLRGPDGEAGAAGAGVRVGAEHLPEALVAAVPEEPEVVGRGGLGRSAHLVASDGSSRRIPARGTWTRSGRWLSS